MEARRVALLGRHPLWLEAVKQIVRALDAEVVGAATALEALLPCLRVHSPDALLVEDHIDVTGTDVITFLARIRRERPEISVLVVSGNDDHDTIAPTLAAGAFACVLRTAEPGDLAAALRQIFERSFYLLAGPASSTKGRWSSRGDAGSRLTLRERDVLALVARGCSNVEIAEILTLCVSTVKAHLSRAYEKLGARNRTEAILLARLVGGLGEPPEKDRARVVGRR